jgi:hypothetical protein
MSKVHRSAHTTANKGSCWPTKEQELLLRAALLQGSAAIAAWHEWESNVDIDQLDQGSQRLLPLLYRNLRSHKVETPLMGRFKGVYRATWYKNRTAFHDMAVLLDAFHDAGIQTLILKGAALVLLHYKDHGLRPMSDFDILVPTEQAPAAMNLLVKLGWRPKQKPLKAFSDGYFSFRHGHEFQDSAGRQLDLHWHALLECCYTGADDDFWDSAVLTKLHGMSTYALNPTDQLLHVCVHGAEWNPIPPFRWVADAMIIMNTSQAEIDWDRFIAQAQKRRLILQLEGALSYLQNLLNAPIPPTVLQSMRSMTVSRIERMEYQARTRLSGLTGVTARNCFCYLRSSQSKKSTALRTLVGFPRFLQHVWALDHLWQVPLYAVSKVGKRARAR